jgi:hypothetical protein
VQIWILPLAMETMKVAMMAAAAVNLIVKFSKWLIGEKPWVE